MGIQLRSNRLDMNSYLSAEEARELCLAYPDASDFVKLEDKVLQAYLRRASNEVDSVFMWKGKRLNEEQVLEFPRATSECKMKAVPENVKQATLLIALSLLNGSYMDGVSYEQAGSVMQKGNSIKGSIGGNVYKLLSPYRRLQQSVEFV